MNISRGLAAFLGVGLLSQGAMAFNYGEALQKSIYFYEEQQSGPLPAWNRVSWRGNAAMTDGAAEKVDLTGGWFDAGDHVKFGLPMSASATMLAWGVVEYPAAYERSGQMQHIKNNLKFVADYLVKAHTAPDELWGQVGTGSVDHTFWGAPEVMQMARPAAKIDPSCPGSDLAGETSAALSSISMVFASTQPDYAANLLEHAKQLYDFAYKYQGRYSECITDAKGFYNSWSGYKDELVWAPLWLYRATGDKFYLQRAVEGYAELNTEQQSAVKSYHWTHSWDDVSYGSYVLLAKFTGEAKYQADAERWLDYWTVGYEGSRVRYTPGGLAYLDSWAATRYSADTAFVALVYADLLKSWQQKSDKAKIYYDFAVSQIEYILGNNPQKMSYLIGYGANYPQNPHHRGAHGSWSDSIQTPAKSRHLLIGALVGGPDANDKYEDDRSNYTYSEVATDYNAAFTSALARLYLDFGGEPIAEAQFPPTEVRDLEFYIEAKANSQGPRHIEIAATVNDHTAWPAKVSTDLHFRYFVNLTKLFKAGYHLADITLTTAYSQASAVTGLHPFGNGADNIYYVDASFAGVKIYPGGQSASKREVQFRLSLPTNSDKPEWSNDNDPSWDAYDGNAKVAPKIALYAGDKLVWGHEPAPDCGKNTDVSCPPQADDKRLTTKMNQSVTFTPSGAEVDGTISGFNVVAAPKNGQLTSEGAEWIYTPNHDFAGVDSCSYVAVDDKGVASKPATVTFTVDHGEVPGALGCTLGKADVWNGGFVINNIKVTNATPVALHGWKVSLKFHAPVKITNIWNATSSLSSDNMEATIVNLPDNGNLDPGQSATFGLQGSQDGSLQLPECTSM